MNSIVTPPITRPIKQASRKAEWRTISKVALKASHLPSLDELLDHALQAWLERASPPLRWQIALELYQSEQVSLGRAAEIAGMNYFVFVEKLSSNAIALIEVDCTTETQEKKQKALVHGAFHFSNAQGTNA